MITMWMIVLIYADGTGMSGPVYHSKTKCIEFKTTRPFILRDGDHVVCAPVNVKKSYVCDP